MTKRIMTVLAICVMALPLAGCFGLAVGAGATAGVAAAQEGGIRTAASDTSIRVQITDAWFRHSAELYRRVSMTVKEGRVLVTGSVPTPDMRVDAIRLVWQVNGVKQVINEIQVDAGDGITGYVRDSWITSTIRSKILIDKYVQSINFTVETVAGTVYVMGVAQDQRELDRVMNYARSTSYVKNVVSYVRLRGEIPTSLETPPLSDPVSYN